MFCIYLRKNSDLCHLQYKLICFYNQDEKCLQRGTDWGFKYSGLRLVFKGLNKQYEIHNDGEIFINCSTVTAGTADSHSIADTVDTDCLTVVAVNRRYCRQINWQLLAERQSECQNAIGRLIQV